MRPHNLVRFALSVPAAGLLTLAVLAIAPGTAFASSVSSTSVSLSTASADASGVTYTIGFTVTSGLTSDADSITLTAPLGTVFPDDNSDYYVTDLTNSGDSNYLVVTLNDSADEVSGLVDSSISAGDSLSLAVTGVKNPSKATGNKIDVFTSADTTPVSTPAYTIKRATAVTAVTATPNSRSADASGVTYTVALTTKSEIIGGQGSITLIASPGTVFPDNNGDYYLTDVTHPADSNYLDVTLNGSGDQVSGMLQSSVSAGDHLSLAASDSRNPTAGTYSFTVFTSSDTTPVTASATYKIRSATAVRQPAVTLSDLSAGASEVTYTVDFKIKSALKADDGSITLIAPQGTVFLNDGGDYFLTDIGNSSEDNYLDVTVNDAGNEITGRVLSSVAANSQLSLAVTGVTNPPLGTYYLTVLTSSDTVPVLTAFYTVHAATAVRTPTVGLSSNAGLVTGVTYTVAFTATSALESGNGPGAITITAPAGTVFPANNADYYLTDLTNSAEDNYLNVTVSGTGAQITGQVYSSIAAGDSLSILISGVSNPGAGSYKLLVLTSADTTPVDTPSYSITGSSSSPTSVTGQTVSLTATDAGASAGYTVAFKAPSALAANTDSIVLAGPAGTVWGADATVTDTTHSTGSGSTSPGEITDNGSEGTYLLGESIEAGDQISIAVQDVTNTRSTGSYAASVSTSKNTAPANTSTFTIGAATAVSSVSLSLSASSAGANNVTYTVGFTVTSALPLYSEITVAAPAGTAFPDAVAFDVTDATHSSGSGPTYDDTLTDNGATATFSPGEPVRAGDQISISMDGVTNPASGTSDTISVSTTSDPVITTSGSYAIGTATAVGSPSVSVSASSASASGVVYTVGFEATSALVAAYSTVTVSAPAGTVFSNGVASYLADTTHSSGSGYTYADETSANGATVTFEVGESIQAGDEIVVTLGDVSNPVRQSTTYQLSLSTSSDMTPVASPDYTIGAETSVTTPTAVTVSPSTEAASATYTFGMTVSSALVPGGSTITVTAPAGTVWPSGASFSITDNTNNSGTGGTYEDETTSNGAAATFSPGEPIQAGDQITISISGVTNPPTSNTTDQLSLSTSTDQIPILSPDYAITP